MEKCAETPGFWPLTCQWTDRRLTTVDHQHFARRIQLPATVEEHRERKAEIIERVRFAVGLDILPPFSEKAPKVFQKLLNDIHHLTYFQTDPLLP